MKIEPTYIPQQVSPHNLILYWTLQLNISLDIVPYLVLGKDMQFNNNHSMEEESIVG